MILNLEKISHHKKPFEFITLYDVVTPDMFERLCSEAQRHPYFRVEQTRTSNPNRVWLNQTPGWLSALAYEFDRRDVKSALGFNLGGSFVDLRTRVELCMDSVGSWLNPHKDDAAKEMTLQLYLDGQGRGTSMGNIDTQIMPNTAWAFNNTNQPVHSLHPLKYNRASIIVNYVNDQWRDSSVLV